ncbi:MAG: GPI anchored serine-threonine rich family protein [Acidobacteriota bacterium]|nr:GPI anchored serine-threonine rich family protein [Acidobacteriota bacterium]
MYGFREWIVRGFMVSVALAVCVAPHQLWAVPPTGTITVISPNGGENWPLGVMRQITWTTSGITSGTYQITLWKGGVSQGVLATRLPYTQHTFDWTVGKLANAPDATPGSGYTVKVRLQDEPTYDFSNAPFTIAAPLSAGTINVTNPRGGEDLVRGTSIMIAWELSGVPTTATLGLQLVKGEGVSQRQVGVIATGLSAALSNYSWRAGSIDLNRVLAPAGSGYRIRIRVENNGISAFSQPFSLTDLRSRAEGEASFFDLVLTRVYVANDNLAVQVENHGNRDFTAPRVPFSIWINQESGPPSILLYQQLSVPAGGSAALTTLLPVNPQWCPTCCGVPVSVAVNRGNGALPEADTRNNSKLERLFLKRRDWRMLPIIMLGPPGGGKQIINPRTNEIVIKPESGRVFGEWGTEARITTAATFRVQNCGNYGPTTSDPHYAQGFEEAKLTIQVYQRGMIETRRVQGRDYDSWHEVKQYNPNKVNWAGGMTFKLNNIPIGQNMSLDIPVNLVHPGDHPSFLVFLFKDFREESLTILQPGLHSEEHTFSKQRMEFPLKFR